MILGNYTSHKIRNCLRLRKAELLCGGLGGLENHRTFIIGIEGVHMGSGQSLMVFFVGEGLADGNNTIACSIIKTVIDQLKNISQIEHSRHRSPLNYWVNVICGLFAYCHQPKKPGLHLERVLLPSA